jgi:hypothetical protein
VNVAVGIVDELAALEMIVDGWGRKEDVIWRGQSR